MRYEPHDFEAPTRRAELKEWLATLRGPGKPIPVSFPISPSMQAAQNAWCLHFGEEWGTKTMKRHT